MMKRMLIVVSILALISNGFILLSDDKPSANSEEIVVTATRTKKDIKDIPANVTVISSSEIAEANIRTVDNLLANKNGIDVQGGGFQSSKIRLQMRGLPGNFGAQRILVMMDNRPVNEEYLGDVDFRFLPTENVEKIEIIRGPASALYGSNALGGVINIITKNAGQMPLVSANTNVGSFNTYGNSLQHAKAIGSFDYSVSAAEHTTDGYLTNLDGTKRDWQSSSFSGRTRLALNTDSMVDLSFGANDGTGNEENYIRDQDTDYVNMAYQTTWSKENQGDFVLRVYRNDLNQSLKWKLPIPAGKYDQFTLGAQAQQSWRVMKSHLVTFGIDSRKEDVLVKDNGIIDQSVNSSAVYLQDQILTGSKLVPTIGVRYDRHEEFGGELSPRVGAVYHFSDNTSLRGLISKGYRAPSVSDLYLPATSFGPVTFKGNPELKPETLWSYEIGADHNFNKNISIQATLYQSELKDAWDFMRDPDNIFRPRNVTRMSASGAEVEAKYRIAQPLSAFLNYTYNKSLYKKNETDTSIEGNYVEEIPVNQASLGVRIQPESNTTVNINAKAVSGRYTDPENVIDNKLPKHMVANLAVSNNMNKNSSVFINVNNLFNRQYKEVIDYFQPGRWFETGLSLKF